MSKDEKYLLSIPLTLGDVGYQRGDVMHYEFPIIRHINDVLPHVQENKSFIVAERDDYTVINYVMMGNDTFPPIKVAGGSKRMREERARVNALLRECRGLIFDKNGQVLSRRFHKFFNVGEREETFAKEIDLSKPHVILEKLDGSMITPIWVDCGFRWGTKMGITEVGMSAEVFVVDHDQYVDYAQHCHDRGLTPIFEFCSNKHRIVVDHPEDRLVLLAVRNNLTGEYHSYEQLVEDGAQFDIEVVKAYPGTPESMEHLVESIRGEDEGEGWVIRFEDGHMVKIKNEWYLRLHRVKDRIRFERNVVDVILNEEIDDLKSFMINEDLERISRYEARFWYELNQRIELYQGIVDASISKHRGDRKAFALESEGWDNKMVRSIVFQLWDDPDRNVRKAVIDRLKKSLSSNVKFDGEKENFIPGLSWEEYSE